jgi:hypothetical protein
MKETAELPVAESVKLCIELDEKMQEQWAYTKEDLELVFEQVYGKFISVTNDIMFQCLLYCYVKGSTEPFPINFAESFSDEEIELMSRQKSNG